MRVVGGIIMAIVAIFLVALGLVTLLNQPAPFMRQLPAILVCLAGVGIGFGAYRVLKGRK